MYDTVVGFTCAVNVPARSITISGAIPTAAYVDNIVVDINNVKNPSPALMTGSFTAQIGIDTSSSDSSGMVTLLPEAFQSLDITFDPSTVNTTSNMIVTAVLGNSVPAANGSIVVTFPSLSWTR